jgi:hypothetical protein
LEAFLALSAHERGEFFEVGGETVARHRAKHRRVKETLAG